jgi:hypothetical protein
MKQFWQVTVDLLGLELTPDELGRLVDEMADVGIAVASHDGRLSVTLTAHEETAGDAFGRSLDRVYRHVQPKATVASVEVLADAEVDRRLAEPAFPELAGIAEVAQLLGVSKQRASELQTREGFPAPVAVLRSGPIWRKEDLSSFAARWERKPGRPPLQWQVIGVENGWAGKYDTRGDATRAARNILRTGAGGELTVRGKDGRIIATDTIDGENPTAPRRYLFVQPA